MTISEQIFTILLCAAATQLTRWLPFLIFTPERPLPDIVRFLGQALPLAVFALLVVYCFRDVSFAGPSHGLPELAASAVTAAVHLSLRRFMLSIAAGTAVYMLLVQSVFD